MRRLLYILIPVFVLAGVIAWRVVQNRQQEAAQQRAAKARKSAAPIVRVAIAAVRDIVHEYEGVGNVESRSDVQIAAKTTGRIDYVRVREGDAVKRGDILVRLDPSEIQASIHQQQANNASAQATLSNAQIRYNRTYDIYKQAFTAAQDVDDARAAVAVARSALNAGKAQLSNLQAQLSDLVLRAPVSGYVTGRFFDQGSIVTAGQPIVTVQAGRDVFITTTVPEDVRASIHVGTAATAVFDAYPGQTFKGTVRYVNAAADVQSRQFLVRAAFSNASRLLKPGMYCRINMVTRITHNAVVVPHEAIQKGHNAPSVTVVDDKLVSHPRVVQTGDQDVAGIAITSGVNEGEKVVTLSQQPLKDGQTVRIDPTRPPEESAAQPMVAGGGGGAPVRAAPAGGGASAPTYGVPGPAGSQAGTGAAPPGAVPAARTTSSGAAGSTAPAAGAATASSPSISGGRPAGTAAGASVSPGAAGVSRPAGAPAGGAIGATSGGTIGVPSGGAAGSPTGGGASASGSGVGGG
ncbi:MAG TPA: efflux RND transporter periplasmic adaptor subunit [Chthonomonadaceae bacterium]|nr:efflux RND transporter periplasmic adaptor subunit [Chthonomonadaceae bacterium]